MKLFSRRREKRFCAFCKTPRRVYLKKHVGLTNVVASALFSATVSMAIWSQIDPRGLVIFCLLIGVAEFLVYLRWRLAIVCTMCGFDPVLYKKSPALAARRVREFFTTQIENPSFHLTRSPLLALHRRQQLIAKKKNRFRSSLGGDKTPMLDYRV